MMVMVVSPHRDDETIGCGGTIRGHVERGDRVAVVHLTGEGGATDVEVRAACEVLGIEKITTLSGRAVELEVRHELLVELVAAIREHRPEIVYVPHPEEDDPTHRVTARLVREARWLAAYPILEEAGAPMNSPPATVFEYEVWTPLARPSVFVDITGHRDRKAEALSHYGSQLAINEWVEGALGLNRYRGVTSGQGDYVEAFTVARLGRTPGS